VNDDERLNRLMLRHLAGETTADEERELDQAMAERPALRGELDRLRTVWRTLAQSPPSARTDQAWLRFARRVDERPAPRPMIVDRGRSGPPRWLFALAAGLAAAGLFWIVRPADRRTPVTYSTAAGERASINLGDGSRIELAPNSRVQLRDGARAVDLDGEASFDITHDPRRPFAVRAGGVVVRDIGTRFMIRAYRADRTVRVAVVSGRVAVRPERPGAPEYTLMAGDGASVRGDGATRIAHGFAMSGDAPWAAGLHFKNAPLAAVADSLSWWFDIQVTVGDPKLNDRAITGWVGFDETADEAVRSIALVARARVVPREHGYTFLSTP
jgi:transmembrane sensor